MSANAIKNYVAGSWSAPASRDELPVTNPATGEVIAKVPLSSKSDIDRAAGATARRVAKVPLPAKSATDRGAGGAAEALPGWRRTPPGDPIQPLFKLKQL